MSTPASPCTLPSFATLLALTVACAGYQPGPRERVEAPWSDIASDEDDPSAELYHPGAVPRFDIDLSDDALERLRVAPREYVPGTFRYGSETIDNVGVRLKGSFTFRTIDAKASFKIKFDKFIDDQRFRGLERMTLNNAIEDQSYVAERLTYLAFRRAGLAAPRANNALVTVNGESFGLYVNVETEDDTFLARWYDDPSGNLYEAAETDFVGGAASVFDLETNEKANDRRDLEALVAAAGRLGAQPWEATLAPHLDTNQLLDFCAMESMVSQWDGYCHSRFGFKNFRFYRDPRRQRFEFVVSGADTAMKPLLPTALVPAADNGQLAPASAEGVLLTRCLDEPSCKGRFGAALARHTDAFEAMDLRRWTLAMYAQIAEHVRSDPRREHSVETFELFVDEVLIYVETRADIVRLQRAAL